ncbi:hypothetical protein IH601_08375 [Candidatus Bipolaricaulota bacterium]|jgi:hypothetical protein|nr:hypothetical protein [Candidatus Bipolaricaulota bacterium]TFH11452.1 MAG: hypothetical protein E4H08_01125 [Candidatus Atribacteria bacterium]
MLKIGYALMLVAGAGIVGFAGYHVVMSLLRTSGISLFLKVLILVAGAGVLLTLGGLIIERRKERKYDPRNDESD